MDMGALGPRRPVEWNEAAYNLFRRRDGDDLVLAVPQHRAVPAFLTDEAWRFDRPVACAADAPPGFDPRAAVQGSRLQGYYLFLAHQAPRPGH